MVGMSFIELLLIAVGLSMDAFAVSIGKGLTLRRVEWRHALSAGLWFGGFQGLMPLIGYALGVSFSSLVAQVDHWIAFVLLGFIGGKMVWDVCRGESSSEDDDFSLRTMFLLAVATSIDALAVGVSFAFLGVPILWASLVIALTTLLFSAAGIYIGRLCGGRSRTTATLCGGVVLILIGLKILIEHLFFG